MKKKKNQKKSLLVSDYTRVDMCFISFQCPYLFVTLVYLLIILILPTTPFDQLIEQHGQTDRTAHVKLWQLQKLFFC